VVIKALKGIRSRIPRRLLKPTGIIVTQLVLAALIVGFCSIRFLYNTRVTIPVPHFGDTDVQPSIFLMLILGFYLSLRTAAAASAPARLNKLTDLLTTPLSMASIYWRQLGPILVEWAIWTISIATLLTITTGGSAGWEILPLEIWSLLGPLNICLLSGLILGGSIALWARDSLQAMGVVFFYVPVGYGITYLLWLKMRDVWIPGAWIPTEMPWALGMYVWLGCLLFLPGLLVLWIADWKRDRLGGAKRLFIRLALLPLVTAGVGLVYAAFSWLCAFIGTR